MYVVFGLIVLWFLYRSKRPERRAIVAVLGDIGRSPRIQNHVCSLIDHGLQVDFVGFKGSAPLELLTLNKLCTFHFLEQPKKLNTRGKIAYITQGLTRVTVQLISITFLLFSLPKPAFMIIQNPPAIPTLLIFQFVSFVRGIPLVIDWHNFGFSIMAISGLSKLIVRSAELYEKLFGKWAFLHITVTKAMKDELLGWPVRGKTVVLYDRPPTFFKLLDDSEKAKFLGYFDLNPKEIMRNSLPISNIFAVDGYLKQDRPAFLISSTSWTEDEDFSILLDALVLYEKNIKDSAPNLFVLLTGKGPLKEFYMKKVEELKLKHVSIHTAWLTPEQYPLMLACADIGISLHSSSSGLDLPMKVVDMYGAGLPVLALDFACIGELVINGKNGYTFSTPNELYGRIGELLEGFPKPNSTVTHFKDNILKFRANSWQRNWDEVLWVELSKLL